MSTGVQTAIGKFVWHENNSTDIEKAKGFYTKLFGWDIEVFKAGEMEYPMIKAGDQGHGGFGTAQGGAPSHWLGYVLVESVDETSDRAKGAGGKVIAGPFDVPEVGRMAIIADPQGAVIAAFTPEGEGTSPEGTFVWDELLTSDIDAAKRFYSEVFGWKTRDMDMGGMTYVMFQRAGEADTAGGMQIPPGVESPPHWRPYVFTEDVDASVARAKELGATALMEADDIPNVGRAAILQDPVGAIVGLFKPSE